MNSFCLRVKRLLVCRVLIEHLKNRKETRWHSFNENLDHPETDEKFEKYVNSRMEDGKLHILFRDLIGDTYEQYKFVKTAVSATEKCQEVCPFPLISDHRLKKQS